MSNIYITEKCSSEMGEMGQEMIAKDRPDDIEEGKYSVTEPVVSKSGTVARSDARPVCGRSRVRSSRPAIFFCGDWT